MRTYYLLPEETDHEHSVQNKNSRGKVMFLCTVARPRFSVDSKVNFDRKL
jgi:hypothetical protein